MISDYKIQNEEKQYILGELAVKGYKLKISGINHPEQQWCCNAVIYIYRVDRP